jgi:hypothetical protein
LGLVLSTTVRRLSLSLSSLLSLELSLSLLSVFVFVFLALSLSLSLPLSLSQNPVWTLTWYFNALHNIGFSSTALVRGKSRN